MPQQKAFSDQLFWLERFCFSSWGKFSWCIYNEGEIPGIVDSFGPQDNFGEVCGFGTLLKKEPDHSSGSPRLLSPGWSLTANFPKGIVFLRHLKVKPAFR